MRIRKYRAYHDRWGWAATSDILIFGEGTIRVDYRDEDGDIFNTYTEKTKELHVMDYIGNIDKNNVEIYEGDLVKQKGIRAGYYHNEDRIIEIKDTRSHDLFQNGYYSNENEVIGNIHDRTLKKVK